MLGLLWGGGRGGGLMPKNDHKKRGLLLIYRIQSRRLRSPWYSMVQRKCSWIRKWSMMWQRLFSFVMQRMQYVCCFRQSYGPNYNVPVSVIGRFSPRCTQTSIDIFGMNSYHWGRIFKRLWSPGIDFKESIPPVYVARRAGTIILFLLGSWPP